jgi:uncharacterized membrane protein YcaP (DUF421 family)
MFEETLAVVRSILGRDIEEINVWQMLLRTVVIYVGALLILRWGQKRFIGEHTAFDVILGIMFGSVISRGINSTALLLETLAASVLLVALHTFTAFVAYHSDRFGDFVKGGVYTLVKNGEAQRDEMRKVYITEQDLMEALRRRGQVTEVEEVKLAQLERSGGFSVILQDKAPRILEISVEDGIKMVRVSLE